MASRLSHLALGAASLLPVAACTDALGQTLTVTSIVAGGSVGNLVSAAASTGTLTLAPSTGVYTLSGGGVRLTSGSDTYTVTVSCSGGASQCTNNNVALKVSNTGSPAGRLGALTNFTVAMGTATQVTAPGAGNPINFTIGPIGKGSSKTFLVGFDAPLLPDNSGKASGSASTAFQVLIAFSGTTPSTGSSSTVTANVFRPIAVGSSTAMAFGSIVKPASGSGTVTLTSGGALSTTAGTIVTNTTHSAAAFSVTGEGAQAFTLTVPSSFVMTTGTNALTVTTSSSAASGAHTLSGSLGAGGSLAFNVGGSFPISTATARGAYTGSLVVTAVYN